MPTAGGSGWGEGDCAAEPALQLLPKGAKLVLHSASPVLPSGEALGGSAMASCSS